MTRLNVVSFERVDGKLAALFEVGTLVSTEYEPAVLAAQAVAVYERSLNTMVHLLSEIRTLRSAGTLIPARTIWRFGQTIFELRAQLANLSLELDGLYDHLVRDLGVKRKWLEKVVIFRRYLPLESYVPESLNWGKCEKGTRRVALSLLQKAGER